MADDEPTTTPDTPTETPAPDPPAADPPAADTPAADTPATELPATETPAVETPAAPVAALPAAADAAREIRWTRLILPIGLPVLAAFMIAVFVLNVSRVFLASGDTGALVMGVTLIVVILGGAAGISAAPRLRTSSLVMMVSGLFVVLMAAGLVAAPASVEKHKAAASTEPKGPPAGPPIEVDALGTLKFQSTQFTAKAGIVQINYVSKDGNHTLTFDPPGPTVPNFLLNVPANGTVTRKVLLKPGSYVFYCTLPGHRAAGMQATLTVQ